jgi:dienelactone hydrolase
MERKNDAWPENWGLPTSPWYNLFWAVPHLVRNNLNKMTPLVEKEVKPFLDKENIQTFGALSFCWGATVGAQLSTMPGCVGHVGCHPSYVVMGLSFGPSQHAVLSKVQCPQLYLPANKDIVFPDCPAQKSVQDVAKQECVVKVFERQVHGFVNRGDVSLPEVKEDVEAALCQAEEFFKKVFA